jgi:hypothetical protein
LARNPIHEAAPALAELVSTEWDKGNPYFPPTTWQISNIHGGTGASNVIPGEVVIDFNFRFSTESTPQSLQQRVHALLERHNLSFDLQWTVGGLPFLTTPGDLVTAVQAAILAETGLATELSTTGGTSDGRFIAQICPQVIEFGPPNATIHKIDEHVAVADIEPLKNIYRRTLENLPPGQHDTSGHAGMTVIELIDRGRCSCSCRSAQPGVSFGHGTHNAFDEAAWLVLWRLGLPLDDLDNVAATKPVPPDEACAGSYTF